MDELEPTAAKELSPANRPTTMISAALNNSCKTLEHISGTVNWSSFGRIAPLHISISYVFPWLCAMFLEPPMDLHPQILNTK